MAHFPQCNSTPAPNETVQSCGCQFYPSPHPDWDPTNVHTDLILTTFTPGFPSSSQTLLRTGSADECVASLCRFAQCQ